MSSRLKGCATPPGHHPLAPGTRPAGLIRISAGGQATQVASRPPKVAFWVMVSLTAAALAAVGGELMHARRSPDPPVVSRAAGSNGEANAALVRRFYAAVNDVMRTGGPGPLDAVLAPTFVAHGLGPGADTDRAGLRTYLATLHASFADLRLTVDDLVAGPDAVVVHVAVHGGDHGVFAGTAITHPAAPWGMAESFRIRDGRITELWSSAGASLQPRSGLSVARLTAGSAMVVLDRLRLGEGAGGVAPVAMWPRLVWVEAGTARLAIAADTDRGEHEVVTVRRGTTLALATDTGRAERQVVAVTRGTNGRAVDPETVPAGGTAILRAGDAAVIPGGVVPRLAAVGPGTAVALGMSLAPASPGPPDDGIVDPRWGDTMALGSRRWSAGWPVGAVVEPVASWLVADVPVGPLRLEAGRLELGLGAEMVLGRATGPVLLAVEAGTVGVTAAPGMVAIQQPGTVAQPIDGNAAGSPPPRAATPRAGLRDQLVGAGGSVRLATGATAGLSATSVESVTCLVFALRPEPG